MWDLDLNYSSVDCLREMDRAPLFRMFSDQLSLLKVKSGDGFEPLRLSDDDIDMDLDLSILAKSPPADLFLIRTTKMNPESLLDECTAKLMKIQFIPHFRLRTIASVQKVLNHAIDKVFRAPPISKITVVPSPIIHEYPMVVHYLDRLPITRTVKFDGELVQAEAHHRSVPVCYSIEECLAPAVIHPAIELTVTTTEVALARCVAVTRPFDPETFLSEPAASQFIPPLLDVEDDYSYNLINLRTRDGKQIWSADFARNYKSPHYFPSAASWCYNQVPPLQEMNIRPFSSYLMKYTFAKMCERPTLSHFSLYANSVWDSGAPATDSQIRRGFCRLVGARGYGFESWNVGFRSPSPEFYQLCSPVVLHPDTSTAPADCILSWYPFDMGYPSSELCEKLWGKDLLLAIAITMGPCPRIWLYPDCDGKPMDQVKAMSLKMLNSPKWLALSNLNNAFHARPDVWMMVEDRAGLHVYNVDRLPLPGKDPSLDEYPMKRDMVS